jgi:DNA-binding MarR family transcriptional regulator
MAVWLDVDMLQRTMSEALVKILKGTPAEGLSPIEAHILKSLYKEDGQHASKLARSVGRAATSFTPILDKLANAGYIERRPDTSDRRAIFIHLSPKGTALRADISIALAKLETQYPQYAWKVGADEPAGIAEPA